MTCKLILLYLLFFSSSNSGIKVHIKTSVERSEEIRTWFGTLTNNDNVTIREYFPTTFNTSINSFDDKIVSMYSSMQYELFFLLGEHIYDDIFSGNANNSAYGSRMYSKLLQNFTDIYLHSGELKKRFTAGLELEYNSKPRNVTIEEFADSVYEEFDIGPAFDKEFPLRFATTYQGIHTILIDTGKRVHDSSDLLGLQTKYMR